MVANHAAGQIFYFPDPLIIRPGDDDEYEFIRELHQWGMSQVGHTPADEVRAVEHKVIGSSAHPVLIGQPVVRVCVDEFLPGRPSEIFGYGIISLALSPARRAAAR